MLGFLLVPIAAVTAIAIWFNRVAITRSVVFGGLARAIETQLERIDLARSMPQPAVTYKFPRVDIFVISVVYTDPVIRLVATAPGTIEFGLTLKDLLIQLETTGAVQTAGSCFARNVIVAGELRVAPDLTSARAIVWDSRVLDFSVQLDRAVGALASGLAVQYREDIREKIETAIRTSIEENVPGTVLDYVNEYPTAAEAVLGLIDTAASNE